MKTLVLSGLFALASSGIVALAQTAPSAVNAPGSDDPVQNEVALVTQAHDTARADDDATTDAHLQAPSKLPEAPPASVLLARRAMMLCGWLQNDNDYQRAEKVARRAIAALANQAEKTDPDREERLYWEACLEARILDHKVRAIALLRAAEKLKPDDERLPDLELPLVAAVNAFGH